MKLFCQNDLILVKNIGIKAESVLTKSPKTLTSLSLFSHNHHFINHEAPLPSHFTLFLNLIPASYFGANHHAPFICSSYSTNYSHAIARESPTNVFFNSSHSSFPLKKRQHISSTLYPAHFGQPVSFPFNWIRYFFKPFFTSTFVYAPLNGVVSDSSSVQQISTSNPKNNDTLLKINNRQSISSCLDTPDSTQEPAEHSQSSTKITVKIRKHWKGEKKYVWWDRAMDDLYKKVTSIKFELIIELRDARLPITGTHPLIKKWTEEIAAPHVIVYTHEDLLSNQQKLDLADWTCNNSKIPPENVFFEDLRGHREMKRRGLKEIIDYITECCLLDGPIPYNVVKKVLVAGIPNVGKSSFIYICCKDAILKAKKKQLYHAPKVRDYAGETKVIKSHWMSLRPNIMLIDTPGIFPPYWILDKDNESVYKLALVTALNIHDSKHYGPDGINELDVADYLLWKCNKRRNFRYVNFYSLPNPTDDIKQLLQYVPAPGQENNQAGKARQFINAFNEGSLGTMILDDLQAPMLEETQQDKRLFDKYFGAAPKSQRKPPPNRADISTNSFNLNKDSYPTSSEARFEIEKNPNPDETTPHKPTAKQVRLPVLRPIDPFI